MTQIRFFRVVSGQTELLKQINQLFADVFEEHENYAQHRPSDTYMAKMLTNPLFIPLVAMDGEKMVGAITAYELPKLEQQRSELYIYDLAVVESHRRQGVATGLIELTQKIATEVGAWVVFVQADYVDEPAVKLYEKLGIREEVLHFDIAPSKSN